MPAEGARGTVLFFHGNAGNISHRLDYLLMFNRLRYSTLIVDYRGYGKSTGTPSEEGTYRDAEAAWDYLRHARAGAAAGCRDRGRIAGRRRAGSADRGSAGGGVGGGPRRRA